MVSGSVILTEKGQFSLKLSAKAETSGSRIDPFTKESEIDVTASISKHTVIGQDNPWRIGILSTVFNIGAVYDMVLLVTNIHIHMMNTETASGRKRLCHVAKIMR